MRVWITRRSDLEHGIYAVEGEAFGDGKWFRAADGKTYRNTEWSPTRIQAIYRYRVLAERELDNIGRRVKRLNRQLSLLC